MRLLRKRIRAFFALQAILLLLTLGVSLVSPLRTYNLSPLDHFAVLTAYFAFSLVFAKACWSTRMPSEFRNLWAVAASGITCGGGLYYFWVGHSSLALACHGLIAIIIGSTGLFIFWEGRAASVFHAEARSNPDEQT